MSMQHLFTLRLIKVPVRVWETDKFCIRTCGCTEICHFPFKATKLPEEEPFKQKEASNLFVCLRKRETERKRCCASDFFFFAYFFFPPSLSFSFSFSFCQVHKAIFPLSSPAAG